MQLITSQFPQSAMDPDHPLHQVAIGPEPERAMKPTAFFNPQLTVVHGCAGLGQEKAEIDRNKKRIHTAIVKQQISTRPIHPLLNAQPPEVHKSEQALPRETRRTLAQLRAQKCPMLQTYLHSIGAAEDPSCPLCGHMEHDTAHVFMCPNLPTDLTPEDLWCRPALVAGLLQEWQAALEAG